MSKVIVVVDYQFDFADPNGTLYVKGAETLQPKINQFLKQAKQEGAFIIASRDWHPKNHCSFKEQGGQWPAHCVAGTPGAKLYFDDSLVDLVINKGKNEKTDEYSCIINNDIWVMITDYDEVFVLGVAGDFCVKQSLLSLFGDGNAMSLNCNVYMVEDLTKDVFPEKHDELIKELTANGVRMWQSKWGLE